MFALMWFLARTHPPQYLFASNANTMFSCWVCAICEWSCSCHLNDSCTFLSVTHHRYVRCLTHSFFKWCMHLHNSSNNAAFSFTELRRMRNLVVLNGRYTTKIRLPFPFIYAMHSINKPNTICILAFAHINVHRNNNLLSLYGRWAFPFAIQENQIHCRPDVTIVFIALVKCSEAAQEHVSDTSATQSR